MTFKVLVYADPYTELRPKYVTNALKRDLPRTIQGQETELLLTDRHNFARMTREINPNVIFVPENKGPISFHTRDMTPDAIQAQNDYVLNGGTAVYFGGMSHYALEKIEWFWDNGQVNYKGPKETFCQVNGTLTGPHHRNKLSLSDPIKYQGCFEVPLSVRINDNQHQIERCWQGNCGAFQINEKHNVLAHYDEVDTRHAAAVEIPRGNKGGSFILCSVMPHYRPRSESPLWDKILTKIENKKVVSQASLMIRQTP